MARGNFGSLRGSSITLANRAGWIDKLMTLRGLGIATVVGGIAAAVYGLGKAWYEGSQEATEFNKQLILTGNYAGKTASQLQSLSKSLSGNGITQQAVAEALAKVVGNGSFSGNVITMITDTAAKLQSSVGQSVDETINQFKRIKNEPVQAIKELDNQYHFLTATQLEQITTLEEQGRKTDAAKLAMEFYSIAMRERAADIKESLGTLEKAWKWLGEEAALAWDKMLNIGRDPSLAAKRQTAFAEVQAAESGLNQLSGLKKYANYSGDNPLFKRDAERYNEAARRLKEAKEKYQKINDEWADEGISQGLENAAKRDEEIQKRRNEANRRLNQEYESALQRHLRKVKEIQNSDADASKKAWAIQQENLRYQQEQNRKSRSSGEKAYTDDSATKMLQASKQRLAALLEQSVVSIFWRRSGTLL